ncbi:ribosome-binding factor A [Rickettsiales bacterium]|nr:ribosome-binding factor A [Rickettsiales bacterium]
MKKQRQLQIGEKIKRYLGDIFTNDSNLILSDGNNITINQVDISPDLKNMKIIIDCFSKIKKNDILKMLDDNTPHIRKKLAQELNLRYVPNIKFKFYDEHDEINIIERILMEEGKKFNDE